MSENTGISYGLVASGYNVNHRRTLAGMPRRSRAQQAAQGSNFAHSERRPLYGMPSFTDMVIAGAKGDKQPGQELGRTGQTIDETASKVRDWAFNDPEPSLKAKTLKSFTDLAEQTSAQGSQRHGIDLSGTKYSPDNVNVATSTAATRWSGGLGSYGEPAGSPFGVTPSTFDGVGGAFSGV